MAVMEINRAYKGSDERASRNHLSKVQMKVSTNRLILQSRLDNRPARKPYKNER